MKYCAKREAASGQVAVNAKTDFYQSPLLNTILEEEDFHVHQYYEQWGSILDEIESALRPYIAVIESLKQSEAAANSKVDAAYKKAYEEDRPAYSGMSSREVSDAWTFHAKKCKGGRFEKESYQS